MQHVCNVCFEKVGYDVFWEVVKADIELARNLPQSKCCRGKVRMCRVFVAQV